MPGPLLLAHWYACCSTCMLASVFEIVSTIQSNEDRAHPGAADACGGVEDSVDTRGGPHAVGWLVAGVSCSTAMSIESADREWQLLYMDMQTSHQDQVGGAYDVLAKLHHKLPIDQTCAPLLGLPFVVRFAATESASVADWRPSQPACWPTGCASVISPKSTCKAVAGCKQNEQLAHTHDHLPLGVSRSKIRHGRMATPFDSVHTIV